MDTSKESAVKHRQVFTTLRREIQSGRWKRGERLPSEAELGLRFSVSRITIGRAVRDLQQAGLVDRRAGSGTFIVGVRVATAMSFGLLIPDLGETEIFEPICQGMMASPLAQEHALLWGSTTGANATKEERAWHLCQQYIERQVSGVFFAPLEGSPTKDEWNRRIGRALDAARIPVVLLDRTIDPYPDPGRHDLVGIDNRRAGYVVTNHLRRLGCDRIAFIAPPHAAATVDAREAGYREALYRSDRSIDSGLIVRFEPDDTEAVKRLITTHHADGLVCANDRIAARIMAVLGRLHIRIPHDIRIVGIDDVEYARLLPVALTTMHQPTLQLGDAALGVMLERIARKERPVRQVLLNADLVVRESCGTSPG